MTSRPGFDPLSFGVALLALALGVAAITFASIGSDDVSYARTQWTARLALVLASPAIVLYVLEEPPLGPWWRCFWSAGWLAYLLHAWWAVFRAYGGDVGAIADRQGWVAYTNALVTMLWTLDVLIAWGAIPLGATVAIVIRFVTWALVTASFIVAAAVFRSGVTAELGYALAAALAVSIAMRFLRPS
jgi:hypothetical protein